MTALDTLGVWEPCRDDAAPLRTLRIVDDTARLLRAPEARFEAYEIGLHAFAHNIENRHLSPRWKNARAICRRSRALKRMQKRSTLTTPPRLSLKAVVASSARLIVGADGGGRSAAQRPELRRPAGTIRRRAYLQYPPHVARITISRPSFTPKPALSHWCRFPASDRVLSAWSIRLKQTCCGARR